MVAVEDCADLGTTTESKCATPDCVGCEGRGMCCECLVHDLVVSLGCVGVLSKDLFGLLEFFSPLAEWFEVLADFLENSEFIAAARCIWEVADVLTKFCRGPYESRRRWRKDPPWGGP